MDRLANGVRTINDIGQGFVEPGLDNLFDPYEIEPAHQHVELLLWFVTWSIQRPTRNGMCRQKALVQTKANRAWKDRVKDQEVGNRDSRICTRPLFVEWLIT